MVDTNVLVSALIGKSHPHKIVYDCSAQADCIVTGNTNDFTFSEYGGVQVVSPKYFYENYCR